VGTAPGPPSGTHPRAEPKGMHSARVYSGMEGVATRRGMSAAVGIYSRGKVVRLNEHRDGECAS